MNVFIKKLVKSTIDKKTSYVDLTKKNYPVLAYLVIALFSLFWFKGKDFISSGDFGWPINFEVFLKYTLSIWDWSVAPGYSAARQVASFFPYAAYGYIAYLLGFSSSIFEKVIFFVSFFISGYGFYKFAGLYTESKPHRFISGLMYMLSPYASVVIWNPSYGMSFPFYSFLPMCMYWLASYAKDAKLLGSSLFKSLLLIFLSFVGASYSNPVFFVLFTGFSFFVVLSFTDSVGTFIKKFLIFFIFYCLLNVFWILPVAQSFGNLYTGAQNETAGLISDAKTSVLNSVSLLDGLKELGLWAFNATDAGDSYYTFTEVFESQLYNILATLFVISAILAVDFKSKPIVLLYLLLTLGVLLNSGLLLPFPIKNLVGVFYDLPFLDRALRSVFLKTGIITAFSMSLLTAHLLSRLKALNIERVAYIVLLVILSYRVYPFISAEVIKPKGNILPSYSFNVPADYFEMSDYIDKHLEEEYILTLPLPKSYNYVYKWRDGGYTGSDFFRSVTPVRNYYVNMGYPAIQEFANTYDLSILSRLGVEYLLLHKDTSIYFEDRYLTNDFSRLLKALNQDSGVTEVYSTQNLSLYKLPEIENYSLFQVYSGVIYVDSYSEHVNTFSTLPESSLLTNSFRDTQETLVMPRFIDNTGVRHEVWNEGWAWPQSNVSPMSVAYPVYRLKEYAEGAFLTDAEDVIDYYLWITSKRISELSTYNLNPKMIERIESDISSSLDRMKGLLTEYRLSAVSDEEYNAKVNKVLRYLDKGIVLLPETSTARTHLDRFSGWLRSSLINFCTDFCFLFTIPASGNYTVENLSTNINTSKVEAWVLDKNSNVFVNTALSSNLFLEEKSKFVLAFDEDELRTAVAPVVEMSETDNPEIYASSTFSDLFLDKGSEKFKTVTPHVLSYYFEIQNLDPIYEIYVDFIETDARMAMDLIEIGKYPQDNKDTAVIGDMLSKVGVGGGKKITQIDNVVSESDEVSDSLLFSKMFRVSSSATGVLVRLYVYSLSGEVAYTKINDLALYSIKIPSLYLQAKHENHLYRAAPVDYVTYTPTHYNLDVPSGWKYLVFNAGFDSGWQISYGGNTLPKFVADGYKNGFLLPDDFEGGQVELIYQPEHGRKLGLYVSIFSLLFVLSGLILTSFYRERRC